MPFPMLSALIGRSGYPKELFKGSSLALVLRLAGMVVTYGFNFLIARMFGASAVGAFALATTVVMILGMLSRIGFDRAIVRFVASNVSVGKQTTANRQYRLGLIVLTALGVTASAAMFFGSDFLAIVAFDKPWLAPTFRLISPAIVLYSICLYNAESLRGLKKIGQFATIRYVLIYFLAIPLLFLLQPRISSEMVPVAAFMIATAFGAVASLGVAWKSFPMLQNGRKTAGISLAAMLAVSLPMLLSNSMGMVIQWTDTLMLGRLVSDVEVGVYAITFKLAFVMNIALNAVNSISTPKFAEIYASRDSHELARFMRQTTSLLFYCAIPILIVLMFAGKPILGLFGEEFRAGYIVLVVLIAGQFVSTISGPVGNLMQMTGLERKFLTIVGICAFLNVILNIILIPRYGIVGAAIASALTLTIKNFACVAYIYVRLGFITIYLPFVTWTRNEIA